MQTAANAAAQHVRDVTETLSKSSQLISPHRKRKQRHQYQYKHRHYSLLTLLILLISHVKCLKIRRKTVEDVLTRSLNSQKHKLVFVYEESQLTIRLVYFVSKLQ